MFHLKPNTNEDGLHKEIDRLLTELVEHDADTESYSVVSARLQELYKLREVDSTVNAKKRESSAAWAAIAANLATVAMIVGHERAHVITSKAISFVSKLK